MVVAITVEVAGVRASTLAPLSPVPPGPRTVPCTWAATAAELGVANPRLIIAVTNRPMNRRMHDHLVLDVRPKVHPDDPRAVTLWAVRIKSRRSVADSDDMIQILCSIVVVLGAIGAVKWLKSVRRPKDFD